jgi:hypothetical protein
VEAHVAPVTSEPAAALTDTWREQRKWSRTADALKRDITRWRGVVLGLIVAGAVLETAAAMGKGPSSEFAYAGAIALGLVPVIRGAKLTRERTRDWVRARSASESLKAEAYTYLTRTGPYAQDDAAELLGERTGAIQNKVRDLFRHSAGFDGSETPPADRLSIEEYITRRIDDQVDGYYERKARELSRRLSTFRTGEFALTVMAAVLGIVAANRTEAGVGLWAAVVTTIIGALAAHVEAARYEYDAISYLGTAQRLRALRTSWRDRARRVAPTAEDASVFVRKSEEAISSENQSWMAEFLDVNRKD